MILYHHDNTVWNGVQKQWLSIFIAPMAPGCLEGWQSGDQLIPGVYLVQGCSCPAIWICGAMHCRLDLRGCGQVEMALDSRSKGLGLILTVGHVPKCQANFLCHTATTYPAVMGTWWTRIVTGFRLKLLAYSYDMCSVFSQGRSCSQCMSNRTMEGKWSVEHIWYRYILDLYDPLPLPSRWIHWLWTDTCMITPIIPAQMLQVLTIYNFSYDITTPIFPLSVHAPWLAYDHVKWCVHPVFIAFHGSRQSTVVTARRSADFVRFVFTGAQMEKSTQDADKLLIHSSTLLTI